MNSGSRRGRIVGEGGRGYGGVVRHVVEVADVVRRECKSCAGDVCRVYMV